MQVHPTRPTLHGIGRAWVLLLALLLGGVVQAARLEDDALDGAALDSCRWFDWSQNARPSHDRALLLHTDGTQSFSNAFVTSQYTLGDAAAEVDIDLRAGFDAPVPDSAQLYAGLGLWVDGGNFVFIALARTGQGLVVRTLRATQGDGAAVYDNPPTRVIAGSSTRLRIARSGGSVTLAWREGGQWLTAARFEGFAAPALVTLQASSIGIARAATAAFSGFTLGTESASSYRPYLAGDRFMRPDFMAGGVVTDYLYQRDWAQQWRRSDPLQTLADNGMRWVRTGVTTLSALALRDTPPSAWGTLPFGVDFWSSLEATGQVLKEAQTRRLGRVLFFYLSDTAAHAGRQNAPPAWRGLSLAETAARVREHTAVVAAHYRAQGLSIGLYEVGNETALGLLNFSFGDRVALPDDGVDVFRDMPKLRRWLWRDHAVIYKAAIDGIRSVDPQARIGLHVEGQGLSPGDVLVKAFFRAMVDAGVPFDVAGLSLPYASYPWTLDRYSTTCWFQRLQETADALGAMGKAVLISEASHPTEAAGTVARPMVDFPFTLQGQAAWVREHLRFGNNHPHVAGLMYFYPEWKPGASTDPQTQPLAAAGLFDATEQPRPALAEFTLPAGESRTDCLLRWAEGRFPEVLAPAGGPTRVLPPFVFRHYGGSGAYVGLAGVEPRVYFLGPGAGAQVQDLGPAGPWLDAAGCSRPAGAASPARAR